MAALLPNRASILATSANNNVNDNDTGSKILSVWLHWRVPRLLSSANDHNNHDNEAASHLSTAHTEANAHPILSGRYVRLNSAADYSFSLVVVHIFNGSRIHRRLAELPEN